MIPQVIEYLRVCGNQLIIKERNCPERILDKKEMRELLEEMKRTKKWERVAGRYFNQKELI